MSEQQLNGFPVELSCPFSRQETQVCGEGLRVAARQ